MPGGRGHKVPFEKVKLAFEARGYTLLSTEYIDNVTNLDFICPKGHNGSMSWTRFARGCGCLQCAQEARRASIDHIRTAFAKRGYLLLSTEYKNCDTRLEMKCPKGHINSIAWSNFKQGHGCSECNKNRRITIEQVRQVFLSEGYTLVSTKCTNAHGKLQYKCSRGHTGQITWNDFHKGTRCPRCHEYKMEKKLGEILEELFPGQVRSQSNLGFLGRQKVDYMIENARLAFEYDGEQHFKPVRFQGISSELAEEVHTKVVQRDQRKNRLCQDNNYTLIRIGYEEKMSTEHIRGRIEDARRESLEE